MDWYLNHLLFPWCKVAARGTLFMGGAGSGGAWKVVDSAWNIEEVAEGSGPKSRGRDVVVCVGDRAPSRGCLTR